MTTLGRPAPPGREVVKTFRGRGDGVLVGVRTLEEHSRRGRPLKPWIERILWQRQQRPRPRGGTVRYVPLGGGKSADDFRIIALDTGTDRPGLEKRRSILN